MIWSIVVNWHNDNRAKPYLRAAQQLEQKEFKRNADFVNAFNTILLELTLFGKYKTTN